MPSRMEVKELFCQTGKVVYRDFFANNEWVCSRGNSFGPVRWRGRESTRAFCIGGAVESGCPEKAIPGVWRKVRRFFDLSDDARTLFEQAVRGDGREWLRINWLNSSSLLAFLCFHTVSAQKPLHLTVCGREEVFTEVRFEFPNEITTAEGKPSNVDVVLLGKDVVLFLESKFSEYLADSSWTKKYDGISTRRYGKIYCDLFDKINAESSLSQGVCESGLFSLKSNDGNYLSGIKQLVSHYLGIQCSGRAAFPTAQRCLLAEIVFSFGGIATAEKKREDYAKLFRSVARGLNGLDRGITVEEDLLDYREVFKDFALHDSVRDFYGLRRY